MRLKMTSVERVYPGEPQRDIVCGPGLWRFEPISGDPLITAPRLCYGSHGDSPITGSGALTLQVAALGSGAPHFFVVDEGDQLQVTISAGIQTGCQLSRWAVVSG